MKGTKRECPENDGQGASDPNGLQGTAPRRRRVQFAAETKIHCVEREAEPEDVEKSPGLHPAVSAAPEETPSQAEMLDAQYTKETVEDLRRKKKALAAGVHRLGLGPRGFDFNVFDSAAAAHAAGEADPDQADAGEVPLEPFNMRREMQEGTFDGDGNYLWRKTNPDEVSDPWLDSLGETKGDLVRRAPHGPSQKGKARKQRVLPALAAAAEREEAEAAAAVAAAAEGGEAGKKEGEPNGDAEANRKAFEDLTEICTALLATGRNVYFLTKTQLEEMLQSEKAEANEHGGNGGGQDSMCQSCFYRSVSSVGTEACCKHINTAPVFLCACSACSAALSSSSGEVDPVYWQFRWLGNSNDKEIHGPYSSENFRTWIDQNFISERNPVEVRRVSAANDPLDGVWLNWVSVDFRSDEQTQKDMQLQEERDARWEAEEDARLQKEAGRGRQAMKEEDDDD
ncbi:CD2 antigen cytoplasmic tail-binding protein 2 [Cyclospora cayetanensis]|uniref:CD2 antigen cytoplasmic tail-binding protein 2 n=1 Tax=Cyclospora cayetanensis TaxID=88456 RepID=A0A6P6S291_9EIME|nr:CD2 antigen cytoplasmic tail-binding protein 2 [Cyclospora cayetanensis]